MSRYFRKCFVLGASLNILSVGSLGLAGSASANKLDPDLRITVLVYNDAQIPRETLLQAKGHASRVFLKAGTEVALVDCPTSPAEISQYPACHQLGGGPSQLQLNILPRAQAERFPLASTICGFAVQAPEDQFSKYAYVFSHRAREIADRVGADAGGLLLGHLIAHEVGHLLLGPGRHSSKGIMRPQWSRKDAKVASSGELLFTRAQGRRIRAQVLKRIRAEQNHQPSRPGSVLSSVQADPEPEVKVHGDHFAPTNGRSHGIAYGD